MTRVDTALSPPSSRTNVEEAAYVVVDLQFPTTAKTTKWQRLYIGKTLVIDFAPTGEPVLVELQDPFEAWHQAPALALPDVRLKGTAHILTAGHMSLPIVVSSNGDRTLVLVSWGVGERVESVRVASGLVFELAHVVREGPNVLNGRLVGLWLPGIPKLSPHTAILRAIGVVGPPIGNDASQKGSKVSVPARPPIASDLLRRH